MRDAQDIQPKESCAACGGEIYPGESVYIGDRGRLCPDCMKEHVKKLLEESPDYVARCMGFDVVKTL